MQKKTYLLIIFAGTLAALLGSSYLDGTPTSGKSASACYADRINKNIRMYLIKEHLYKNSMFEHIRNKAALAKEKAAFLKTNRDRLIAEMSEQGVGRKHYHIHAFLYKRFHESRGKEENRIAYQRPTGNE